MQVTTTRLAVVTFLLCAAVLAAIAWRSPVPDRATDRGIYELSASEMIVPGCNEIHCFRLLVPWTLGRLPGPSQLKWKAVAVVANAAAAVAVLLLSLSWGLPARTARIAAVVSALGFGSLYTLHDAFTADPVMYALGPMVLLLLNQERLMWVGAIAMAGVTAKEFVVAPLVMFSAAAWLEHRRALAYRVLALAAGAFAIWFALQLILMLSFNYSYGNNPSTHLLSGGYLRAWFQAVSPRSAVSALFIEFGAVWLLAPAGWLLAPAVLRRITVIALPFVALFSYVQQPDRALWNFHFIASPLAALSLARMPAVLAWTILGAYALANLRVGAQLTDVPAARFALAVSVLLSAAAVMWQVAQKNARQMTTAGVPR